MIELTIFLAFFTGVISFFSPCNLAVAPLFLSYMTRQLTEDTFVKEIKNNKGRIIKKQDPLENRSALFIGTTIYSVGFIFSLIFIAITAKGIGWIIKYGTPVGSNQEISGNSFTGIIIIIFGLIMVFGKNFLILQKEYKIDFSRFVSVNKYFFPLIIGVSAAFAWTPCLGPVLGTMFTLTANTNTLTEGVFYLLIFGVGNVLPFYLLAFIGDKSRPILRKLAPFSSTLYMVTGVIIIIIGLLIFTNKLLDLYVYIRNFYDLFGYQGL